MRLLMISQDFPPEVGGIQTYAYELARRFVNHCDDFAVVAPRVSGCEQYDRTVPFSVIRIDGNESLFPFRATRAIKEFADSGGLTCVFNVQWHSAVSTAWARLSGLDFKMAVAVHGREVLLAPFRTRLPNYFRDKVRAYILNQADVLLPVSNYTSSLVAGLGISYEKMSVVHNGADVNHFKRNGHTNGQFSNGSKTVLTVSRLVQRKGIDVVIRTLPSVLEEVPGVRYVIAGDGPEKNRLEDLASQLNVDSVVKFVGTIPYQQLPDLYNSCDVFVMPSRNTPPDIEGFGIVFLEANACGKPVIGARTGGIPDAIVDGETGILVDPDNEEQLANAIIATLTNSAMAERLGSNGHQRVNSQHTWDHVAQRVLAAISGISLNGNGYQATAAP